MVFGWWNWSCRPVLACGLKYCIVRPSRDAWRPEQGQTQWRLPPLAAVGGVLVGSLLGPTQSGLATSTPTAPCPTLAAPAAQELACSLTIHPQPWLGPVYADNPPALEALPNLAPVTSEPPPLELHPSVIEQSPVLQRWLEQTPDIASEIRNQPSFRTRLRVGYANFPSAGEVSGVQVGVEDVFLIPGTGLTASGDYSRSGNGQHQSYGGEARYYLLPLGGYVNLAPTIGYRALSTPEYSTDGLNLGLRLMVIPSRGGGADLAISQQWVAPGSENEVGLTSLTLGYAISRQLRLGTDLQFQNSRFGQESRWGLSLEWLL